ncbi:MULTISPECIES: type IV secretion system protein TraC [Pseudomonas]|uniref:type IV secretion system protein TraC n=1 Tax=Pseudomonas TaxID=286 RepID=UPI000D39609B|nr:MULTISPECIES: type IV secretion system protein TraC [Pseudomonas]NMY91896.1 type IV secretion system protein TraC [Pseudomonas psychrotolerans]NMY92765.1 type IV secretion system protein TraC [Pseudomonas psychrotolerans]RAU32618.1 type IV secretion system protein TraC [Pseudomonas sp. RIT 411]UUW74283.1 type IV secretion system protein TraC [Pseudomonas psychrotolerans]
MTSYVKGNFPIGDLLSVTAFDEANMVFLLDDNQIGFSFLCQPLPGSDGKEGEQLKSVLKQAWPANASVNFCLFASQNINNPINAMLRLRNDTPEGVIKTALKNRSEYLFKGTLDPIDDYSGIKVRDIHLVITVMMPIANVEPTDRETQMASEIRSQFDSVFKSVGLAPIGMGRNLYLEVMSSILNQGAEASWRDRNEIEADDDKPLKVQLLDYDRTLIPHKDHLQIGDTLVKCLSVKKFPRRTLQGAAGWYLGDLLTGATGIRENCLISFTIYFPEQQGFKDKLGAKRQWVNNQAYGPLLKFVPKLGAKKHGMDALFKELDEGESAVRCNMTMVVFAPNRDRLIRAAAEARNYMSIRQFTFMEDRFFVLPIFLNALPFGADPKAVEELYRYKSMAITQALPLVPIYADWKGTGTPTMQFVSRNGQLMSYCLFDSDTNYNATIAAQSGSGKSFLTNYLITSYRSIGAQVWVIDVGRSYLKLAKAFDGDFVEFTQESQICLNPFELVQDYSEEEDVLIGLLSAMAAPTAPLLDLQIAGLRKHTHDVFEKLGGEMVVDDVEKSLLSDEDPRVQDIGKQLYPFTRAGMYGKFFNGKNNVDFKNPFTVLELEELKGRKHLQQVVLLQLIYQIQQAMYLGSRDQKKIVIIDEAWSLLTEGDVAKFIEHGYRRFRKYNGSAITITQSVNDLYANSTGRAIVENSAHQFLLGQKASAIDLIQKEKRLSLTEGGFKLLKSVHTVRGQYSEIFFSTEHGSGIGRLTVDKYSNLLYSTFAKDVEDIGRYTDQGIPTAEAITRVMADRGLAA